MLMTAIYDNWWRGYNDGMENCPVCESFVRVGEDQPCYVCGLSLIAIAVDKMVAIVPGWFVLEAAKPRFADTVVNRLKRTTEYVILDFSQVGMLSADNIGILENLHRGARSCGLNVVVANAGPHIREAFKTRRLNKSFRFVEDIEQGLEYF